MLHMLLHLANRLDEKAGTILVVVETPRGGRTKLDLDPELGAFVVKSVLPVEMIFPTDFGFIPSTQGEDGDPLDVMLLSDEPGFPGSVVHARLIGVIEGEQTELDGRKVRNDRLLAVPCEGRAYRDVDDLAGLPSGLTDGFCAFWTRKAEEEGKRFSVLGVRPTKQAVALVKQAACPPGSAKLG
jgi:inorganic pyrophosphatase